jgi:ubiquinone/menaquinone biosynthesis C-methylase UbiE
MARRRKTDDSLIKETKRAYETYGFIDASYRRKKYLKDGKFCLIPLSELKGKRILDAGCGIGALSLMLSQTVDCNLTLLDLSLNNVREAMKKLKGANVDADVICGDVLKLPFRDCVFDFVISAGVIHHTPSARDAFREIARTAKKGVYLSVYNKHNFYHIEFLLLGGFFKFIKASHGEEKLKIFMKLFHKIYSLLVREKLPFSTARSLFADRYLTPQASFHSKEEILAWAEKYNLSLKEYSTITFGNLHQFYFVKK